MKTDHANLVGTRFGRLTVKSVKRGRFKCGASYWLASCKCDCGKTKDVAVGNLKNGLTKSCGCLNRELTARRSTKHGLCRPGHRHPLYYVWWTMIQRCSNPKTEMFHAYGGRGISVCDEWRNSSKSFFDWALSHGYRRGLSIDRIDSNGNYCPENCRWATAIQQANNQRTNHMITINGVTMTAAMWARSRNWDPDVVHSRLNHGWSEYDAVMKPYSPRTRPSSPLQQLSLGV